MTTTLIEGFGADLPYGTKLTVHRTENGRYFIVKTNKGKVAKALRGKFLSAEKAGHAIATYVFERQNGDEKPKNEDS